MRGLHQDLRFAVRSLARQPGFTATAVLILGFAMAATTTIYSVVDAVLFRPLPYGEPERVVAIHETAPPEDQPFAVAPANFLDWREASRSFEYMAAIAGRLTTFTGDAEPVRIRGQRVSSSYFRVLGAQPFLGRDFHPDDESETGAEVVILSHGLWQRWFGGDPELVGRTVPLAGVPHTVIGIMPRAFTAYTGPWNPEIVEFWTPDPFVNDPPAERMAKRLQVIARLAPAVTAEQARAELSSIASGLAERYPESNEGWGAQVVPMQEHMVGDYRTAFLLVLGAVGFVLLIACANVATLLLARFAERRRELAIRTALGAGRSSVVRLLLTESALLAALGLLVGFLLAVVALPVLLGLAPGSLPRLPEVGLDARIALVSAIVAVGATLTFGVLPSIHAARQDVRGQLAAGGRTVSDGAQRSWGRKALVVAEVALSLVLLAGAGLMVNSFLYLRGADIGIAGHELVVADLQLPRSGYAVPDGHGTRPYTEQFTRWRVLPERARLVYDAVERVAALPGVTAAAAIDYPPGRGITWGDQFTMEGEPPPEDPADANWASVSSITPDYLDVMGIPVLRGRTFSVSDGAGAPEVAIISRSMAERYWPDTDPIGARLDMADGVEDRRRTWEIVAIVGDVRRTAVQPEPPNAHIYIPQAQRGSHFTDWQIAFPNRFSIVARASGRTDEVVAGMREAIWSLAPDQPIDWIGPMSSYIYQVPQMAEQRFYTLLIGLLGAISLVLAVGGLFGVVSYLTAQRTHEIGIRMALGAQEGQVLRLVLRQSLVLVAVGVVLGIGGAMMLSRLLESWIYGIEPRDAITLALTAALLVVAALMASLVPARRASRTDPMIALRTD